MPRYPHMLAEDTEVWTEYLKNPVTEIKEVWYDVHVGGIPDEIDKSNPLNVKIAMGIYRKRIDVVCRVAGGFWVVEVKPRGGITACGQALAYASLFAREYLVDGEIMPVVICREADEDLIDHYDDVGVGLITTGG